MSETHTAMPSQLDSEAHGRLGSAGVCAQALLILRRKDRFSPCRAYMQAADAARAAHMAQTLA